jgi:hypothetical protein
MDHRARRLFPPFFQAAKQTGPPGGTPRRAGFQAKQAPEQGVEFCQGPRCFAVTTKLFKDLRSANGTKQVFKDLRSANGTEQVFRDPVQVIGTYFRPIGNYFRPFGTYFCPIGNYFWPIGNYFRVIGSYFWGIGSYF